MNNNKQYVIKVIRGASGKVVYFNFGMDKHRRYTNTETCLNDNEYISITCYNQSEYNDYKEHVGELMRSRARLSIVI